MLERATPGPKPPFARAHAGGITAAAAGALSLLLAFFMQFGTKREVTDLPNPWVTVPLLFVAASGVGYAFARREPHKAIGFVGLAMAAAAVALGWVVVACAVAVGALLVCLIIAKFM